ncbi:MAG TPA: helix-turn-helix domain-containing protein [Isosphaeraceae bacterium]|jgi:DNA-binding transcriptional regulator YiaG
MSKTTSRDRSTTALKGPQRDAGELSPRVREMVDGLHALCDAVEAGTPVERLASVRTCQIDLTPPELSPAAIRAIRESLGLSPALFADFLGVGLPTVRSWEQGRRQPSALARRFLGAIRDDPRTWREKLARAAVRKEIGKELS